MSTKKDKGLNRRSVITTAAAAAGAALPLVAGAAKAQMMGGGMAGRGGASRFVVDLGGVHLPDAVADKLQDDIRRAVLMAVARAQPKLQYKQGPLGPGIRGFVLIPANLQGGGMMHQ